KSEVNFLHAVRDGQWDVTACIEKGRSPVKTRAAGKVRRPRGALLVQRDRFAGVIKRGADYRGIRKLFKQFPSAREVISVDRIRVVVEACDKFELRCLDELVTPAAWSNLFLADQNMNTCEHLANGPFALALVCIDVHDYLFGRRRTTLNDAQGSERLLDSLVRRDDCGDAGFHNAWRSISASAREPASFG